MLKFSKKRFLITLVLSVLVWVVTVFVQAVSESVKYVAFFTQSKCSATGYPVNFCINGSPEFFIYLINIFFWFWIIHLFWRFFEHSHN